MQVAMVLKQLILKVLAAWSKFWLRVEGPELEPPSWHSHYLSARTSAAVTRQLGAALEGVIIDIGAGTGHGARYLAPDRTTYFPTDVPGGRASDDPSISRKPVQLAAECSVYDLPFEEGRFGGAMMLSVLEHLETPDAALLEIFRCVQPGGAFLISVPFAFPLHGAPHDYRRWTRHGLAFELERAGFIVEEVRPCGGAFSACGLNILLALRYAVPELGTASWLITTLLAPLRLVFQLATNLLSLLLDKLDRTGRFPISIVVLSRKPL
jgi:SAM-dependent methyltransferase